MNINDNYLDRFREVSTLLLDQPAPYPYILSWYDGSWESASYTLQDFFNEHSRLRWDTGIGTIEAVELIIQEAVFNANIKEDWSIA